MTRTDFDLAHALGATRINWRAIEAAGHDLRAIADEAATNGDPELARRARRAMVRR